MSKELIEELREYAKHAQWKAPGKAADRIEELERENKRLSDDHYFQACLTRDLMPYQERAIKAEQKCDALQADNARLVEAITEGLDTYKVPRTARICEALAATPKQSLDAVLDPYKAHIERLRKALDVYRNVADPADWSNRPAEAALAATPAQSLDALLDPYKTRIAQLEAENSTLSTDFSSLRAKVFVNGDRRMTMGGRTFTFEGDGLIFDNNLDFDACLRVSGDFAGDEKQQYAQMVVEVLNSHNC